MKTIKNKIAAMTIVILFMLSMTVSIMLTPNANAHSPALQIPTIMFSASSPNPAGVGQTITILFWLNFVPPTAQGPQGDRWIFYYNITDPNGVVTKFGPVTSDDTGSFPTTYVPAIVGNYTFQASFPGQTLAGANPPIFAQGAPYIGDYFEPSSTTPLVITVQQAPVQAYPANPLPSSNTYWQNPIEQNNWFWSPLGGNWLTYQYNMTNLAFNPYTTAPNAAHILWTKSFEQGGQNGGADGNEQTGLGGADQYSPAYNPAIIIDGTLYYNEYTAGVGLPGIVGVNLRTGETEWISNGSGVPVNTPLSLNQPGAVFDNNTFNRLTYGEVLQYVSPDQYGGNTYLWAINGVQGNGNPNTDPKAVNTLRYDMYDASTGAYMLSLTNAMTGTFTFDDHGALCCYILGGGGTWLAFWNSSAVTGMLAGLYGNEYWGWRPMTGQNLNWQTGVQWNVTVPLYNQPFAEAISKVAGGASPGGVVLATTMSQYGDAPQSWIMDIGYDAMTGQQLWAQNRTLNGPTEPYSSVWTGAPAGNGIFTHFDKSALTLYAYSTQTGNQLWSCDAFKNDSLAYYDDIWTMGYGCIYVGSYGGNVYAINQTNGKLVWEWSTGASGTSVPGNNQWPLNVWSGAGVGWTLEDGKLYASTGHAYNPPMFNGARMYCINATTGSLIYSMPGWWESVAVADGELTAFNGYDNAIYAFGKGLTSTTVSAPDVAVPQGSALVIRGTVTDQSPGQTCIGIPAAGTPAIADEYMSAWMAYLYEQQPKPTNATGVPVTISVLDSNGNHRDIGTTISDASGTYSLTWTPDISGNFTVTATFAGSQSYYPSSAETYFYASAQTATPMPTAAPASNLATTSDLMLGTAIIAVIIIVIGAILVVLTLRKRP